MYKIQHGEELYEIQGRVDLEEVPEQVLREECHKLAGGANDLEIEDRADLERVIYELIGQVSHVPQQQVGRGRRPSHDRSAVIRVLVEDNPKQTGSAAHARFECYQDGMTVADYLALGHPAADISYDASRGFIRLESDS